MRARVNQVDTVPHRRTKPQPAEPVATPIHNPEPSPPRRRTSRKGRILKHTPQRYTDPDGYIRILDPNRGYEVYEHRLIMEGKLRRRLRITEVVHHINGKKDDNRMANLQLFASQADHTAHHAELRRQTTHADLDGTIHPALRQRDRDQHRRTQR